MLYYYFRLLWYNCFMFDLSSPTSYIPTIFLTIVMVFIAIIWKEAKKSTHGNTWELPYFDEIALSMNYLNNNIYENGRFQYLQNVDPEIVYKNDIYNSIIVYYFLNFIYFFIRFICGI